ncbi:MAG TPA: hypothetical protein VI322_04770 [Candidatus Saccharimonadia bacterium]
MNIFNRKNPPKWAQILDETQYGEFRAALLKLSDHSVDSSLADKNGWFTYNGTKLMLKNIAEQCANLEPDGWEDTIEIWLQAACDKNRKTGLEYPKDLEQLKLQLYPDDYFGEKTAAAEKYVFREDIPGILTTVVVDLPAQV